MKVSAPAATMTLRDFLKLATMIGVSELAGVVGSAFTVSMIPGWYAELVKPELAPPSWVFGPVWVTLYALMGIAAFLVWRHGLGHPRVRVALILFSLQLMLNALWSVIFFGLRNPGAAFIELIVLWIAIAATIAAFARVSRAAAWLLAPYILWVSFAAYLNFMIWALN